MKMITGLALCFAIEVAYHVFQLQAPLYCATSDVFINLASLRLVNHGASMKLGDTFGTLVRDLEFQS